MSSNAEHPGSKMHVAVAIVETTLTLVIAMSTLALLTIYFVWKKLKAFKAENLLLLVLFISIFGAAAVFVLMASVIALLIVGLLPNDPKYTILFILSSDFGHSATTFCDFSMAGLFVQRVYHLLYPFKPAAAPRKIIVRAVVLISSIAACCTFASNLQSYKVLEHPFELDCYAFNCLNATGTVARTNDFIIRIIGAMSVITLVSAFLLIYRRTKKKITSMSELKSCTFVKYMFLLRSLLMLSYYVPDYIMVKTIGKDLTFLGPYVLMFASLDGLLTTVVYFRIALRMEKIVFIRGDQSAQGALQSVT